MSELSEEEAGRGCWGAKSRQQLESGSRYSSVCHLQQASLTLVGCVRLFGCFGGGRGHWRGFSHKHTNAHPQRNILAGLLAVKRKLSRKDSLPPWKGLLGSSRYSLSAGQSCWKTGGMNLCVSVLKGR